MPRLPLPALLAALLFLPPALAAAQPADPPPPTGAEGDEDALRAEVAQRVKTMRAVALANRLGLDEDEALRLNAVMKRYDEAREGLRLRMRELMRTLRRAAAAETVEAAQVEETVKETLELQAEMAELRGRELAELMQGLDARQKAELMIFYREFPGEVRRMMRRGGPGPGDGGGRGPRGGAQLRR